MEVDSLQRFRKVTLIMSRSFEQDAAIQLPGEIGAILSFVRQGELIVASCEDGYLFALSLLTGEVTSIRAHTSHSLGVLLKDHLLYTTGDDGFVRKWRITTNPLQIREIRALRLGEGVFARPLIDHDSFIIAGCNDGSVTLLSFELEILRRFNPFSSWILTLDAVNGCLAAAGADKRIALIPLHGGEIQYLEGHTATVLSLKFIDRRHLVSGGHDHTWRIWDVPKMNQIFVHDAGEIVWSIGHHQGQLATGLNSGMVEYWNPLTPLRLGEVQVHEGPIFCISENISAGDDRSLRTPDGAVLASSNSLRIWAVAFHDDASVMATDEGVLLNQQTLLKHPERVRTLACHDGKVVTGCDDHVVRIWDIETQELVAQLEGHRKWVISVCFSPDGDLVASGSDDGTVRLWNWRTNTEVIKLDHSAMVEAVSFSPDGSKLVSSSSAQSVNSGGVVVYDIKNQCLHDLGVRASCLLWIGSFLYLGTEGSPLKVEMDRGNYEVVRYPTVAKNLRSIVLGPEGSIWCSAQDDSVYQWDSNPMLSPRKVQVEECRALVAHEHTVYGLSRSQRLIKVN